MTQILGHYLSKHCLVEQLNGGSDSVFPRQRVKLDSFELYTARYVLEKALSHYHFSKYRTNDAESVPVLLLSASRHSRVPRVKAMGAGSTSETDFTIISLASYH